MRCKWVALGTIAVIAAGLAAVGVVRGIDHARVGAWREAHELRLRGFERRGIPTTYAALNRRFPAAPEEENGYTILLRVRKQFDELFPVRRGRGKTPLYSVRWGKEPDSDERATAERFLRDESVRIEAMWSALGEAARRRVFRSPFAPPVNEADDVFWEVPQLLWLRAFAHPAEQVAIAEMALALAGKVEIGAGYRDYGARQTLIETGARLLRRAVERGARVPNAPLTSMLEQVRRLAAFELDRLRSFPMFHRVCWTDHELRREMADYPGGPAALYRDQLLALDDLDWIEIDLSTEEGMRRVACRSGAGITGWNATYPNLRFETREALEVVTKLRLAELTLTLVQLRGESDRLPQDAASIAALLGAKATIDALTGEAFVFRVEREFLLIGIPWRDRDFPARPRLNARPPREPDEIGKDDSWFDDDLRDQDWIWAVPL